MACLPVVGAVSTLQRKAQHLSAESRTRSRTSPARSADPSSRPIRRSSPRTRSRIPRPEFPQEWTRLRAEPCACEADRRAPGRRGGFRRSGRGQRRRTHPPATTRNSGRAQPADILHRHVPAHRQATREAIGQRLPLHPRDHHFVGLPCEFRHCGVSGGNHDRERRDHEDVRLQRSAGRPPRRLPRRATGGPSRRCRNPSLREPFPWWSRAPRRAGRSRHRRPSRISPEGFTSPGAPTPASGCALVGSLSALDVPIQAGLSQEGCNPLRYGRVVLGLALPDDHSPPAKIG